MGKIKKVIYASSAMREEDFLDLFRDSKKIPGQQAQKFNRLLIKGIEKNDVEVLALSAPPVNRSNCPSRVKLLKKKREGKITYKYLPIVNIRGIKNFFVMLLSFLHTFFASIGKNKAIVCDVLNISVAMGAVSAGRLLGKPCVGIVTDVPELMVTGHTPKMVKYCYKIIKKCTQYVFLTEAMNDRLNPMGKPYVIIEGVCDVDSVCDVDLSCSKQLGCMYAGLLDAEYGVKTMVEGFLKANIPNAKLHICGNGPYVEELKQIVSDHDNVVYYGVLFNQDVIKLEQEVSLLINPRPSTGEFTKFSFPSKNMEYMVSGTPMLTTKLPGIPQDHLEHIYLIEEEDANGVAKILRDLLINRFDELSKKGLQARAFVLEEKNNIKQAQKMLDMLG